MRCSKARKLIEKYVDSELDDALARGLRSHLSSCAACAGKESRVRAVLGLLNQWSAVEPEGRFEALLARVERSDERIRGQADRHMPSPRKWGFSRHASFPRRGFRSFGVPSWAAVALATISIGGGMVAGMSNQQDVPVTRPTEEQVVKAIGLKSFDDMLGASLVYGIQDKADSEEGGSL